MFFNEIIKQRKIWHDVDLEYFFKNVKKLFITFSVFFITKSKFEENAILKPLDVYVLLHLQHFPRNSQIIQI